MPYVTVGRENTGDIQIYYEDHGAGPPVVLVHGYLADGRSWEKQEAALLAARYRVIAYDRRGGGASSRPSAGYDDDTLAADLNILLEELDLREAVLVGNCCGTGEVLSYLGRHGRQRVRAAALLAPLLPSLTRSPPCPCDAGQGRTDELIGQLLADRPVCGIDVTDVIAGQARIAVDTDMGLPGPSLPVIRATVTALRRGLCPLRQSAPSDPRTSYLGERCRSVLSRR
jgi:pimeloyl-ACP methyl ester carboxylesterase